MVISINNHQRKNQHWYTVLLTLFVLFFGLFTASTGKAAELKINGAGASDAVITDADGKNVTGKTDLNKYVYYEASYKWAVPANTVVKAGDTATFTLPNNVQIRVADTSFDVTDENNNVVGTFKIAKGSHTGTLTFNDYFEKHNIQDIHGTLALKVNGTQENAPSDWFLNKAGWLDSQKRANWTVVYNPKSRHLTNVSIKDTLQGSQTFDMNSIELWYGTVDANNQFVADKKITNPVQQGLVKVSRDQTTMTVHFDKLNTAIQLVYKSNANTHQTNFSLVNVVDASSNELGAATMTSTIEVGGDGVADGVQQPTKPDCPNHNHHHRPCRPNRPHHPSRPHYPSCRPQRPCRPHRPVCRPHCSHHHHHYYFNGVAY